MRCARATQNVSVFMSVVCLRLFTWSSRVVRKKTKKNAKKTRPVPRTTHGGAAPAHVVASL